MKHPAIVNSTSPAQRPRAKATLTVLIIAFAVVPVIASGGTIFSQFTDMLDENIPLAGQGQWVTRTADEISPAVAQFLNRRAIVPAAPAASSIAQLQLEPASTWHAGQSFTLEFDVAISSTSADQWAVVGLGSNYGGIPAHVGVRGGRIALRQRHYGDTFVGHDAAGEVIQLPWDQWARIRATFTRESENQAPTVSISLAEDSQGLDFQPVYFPKDGAMVESLPIDHDADAGVFKHLNLFWLRVQGDAAIGDITLTNE